MKQQPTEKNPYMVDNYPYGYLKCLCKFWIESNVKRGDRWVKQTQNPKTLVWNKPKKSTYTGVMIAYLDEEEHATYNSIYTGTDADKYKEFIEWCGDVEFNKIQLDRLKYIRSVIKAYENVTFECVESTGWSDEKHAEHKKEQDNIKDNINNHINYNYNTDGGAL